jgi:hypothetical protein
MTFYTEYAMAVAVEYMAWESHYCLRHQVLPVVLSREVGTANAQNLHSLDLRNPLCVSITIVVTIASSILFTPCFAAYMLCSKFSKHLSFLLPY